MPTFGVFDDTSGLPHTIRGKMPYELEAISPREVWGSGKGTTSLVARQTWEESPTWIRYMVGEAIVKQSLGGNALVLSRFVPEILQYNLSGEGADQRIQYCTGVQQTEQGGNHAETEMRQASTNWPEVDWCKYNIIFETMPYAVRSDDEIARLLVAAGAYSGPQELYRYIIRSQTNYTKEQPIPAATNAGGFRVINDAEPDVTKRKAIGQVGFRNRSFGEISYKWVRVPVGWPPPVGYVVPDMSKPWPPKVNPAAADPTAKKRTRDTLRGKVNDNWFDCGALEGYCCAPGELLYIGYDDNNRYYDAAGDWVMDIIYKFRWCEGGWNLFLSASGTFLEVSADSVPGDSKAGLSTGRRPYESGDFETLFTFTV